MSTSSDLRVDGASLEAARYACEHWHYSKRLPAGRKILYGVWEDARFVGVVIFSRGANNHIGCPYGLQQTEVCELTRIALREHVAPVTRIMAIALRLLKRENPGLRAVVSYADPEHGHHGGIYQGGNWVHDGTSAALSQYVVGGVELHHRTATEAIRARRKSGDRRLAREILVEHFKGADVQVRFNEPKYRYVYPLDAQMRETVRQLAKPYPKRGTQCS